MKKTQKKWDDSSLRHPNLSPLFKHKLGNTKRKLPTLLLPFALVFPRRSKQNQINKSSCSSLSNLPFLSFFSSFFVFFLPFSDPKCRTPKSFFCVAIYSQIRMSLERGLQLGFMRSQAAGSEVVGCRTSVCLLAFVREHDHRKGMSCLLMVMGIA